METKKLIPEDLQCKFKSKQDLYNLLSIDLRYFLPPIDKCPMHFLREVLSGEKCIVKKEKVIDIIVPRFNELSVSNVWPLVRDVDELMRYFPNYKHSQEPDRKYMFCILATFRFEEVKSMIQNARNYRSTQSLEEDNNKVYVNIEIYKEIENVMSQKLTKGKATHLLKRSAKLIVNRKPAKAFPLKVESLKE